MADVANKDEAFKCLLIAKRAVEEKNIERALKFAQKANKLYNSRESQELLHSLQAGSRDNQNQPSSRAETPKPSQADGVRHRKATTPTDPQPQATAEQQDLINSINRAKTYYEILGIAKDAPDGDIKKAYKKLALKLHPDKCKGAGSEEAFKAVSRAFSCLSDTDKRSYYDQTGYENSSAAAAAAADSRGPTRQQWYQQSDEIDPEEIFNMFFGTGFHPHGRMFRTQFSGGMRQQQRSAAPSAAEQQRNLMSVLLQLVPILLIFMWTFFSSSGEPGFSMNPNSKFSASMTTQRLQAPFYVRSEVEFNKLHPQHTPARAKLEREVEQQYYQHVYQRCQQEKLTQHRLYSWGDQERARAMSMPACNQFARLKERMHVDDHNYY